MGKLLKITSFILVFAMLFCLSSCGDEISGRVKVVDIPLTDERYAFAVNEENAQLLLEINAYIKEIKADGTLNKIIEEYYSGSKPEPIESAAADSDKSQLIVVTNTSFPPFEMLSGDKMYGIDLEVMRRFAGKTGRQLVIKNVSFSDIYGCLQNGEAHIAASALEYSEKSVPEKIAFSDVYFEASLMIAVTEENETFDECKKTADVMNILYEYNDTVAVGFHERTKGQAFLEGEEAYEFNGLNVTHEKYSDVNEALEDVADGDIDFYIIDETVAKLFAEKFNTKVDSERDE